MESIIKLEHVTKELGNFTALADINLEIRPGEIFGIIGLSGAGKSTLVRCINCLGQPTSGKVFVDGKQINALSPAELRLARRNIGMVFQSFNLLMQSTALDNVAFPLILAGERKETARERARAMLERVGLGDRMSSYPSQLSGGQMQRVAIARALVAHPKVLLCDEATSALDPVTTQSILKLLQELNREMGVTVVIITHEMAVVSSVCQRVAVMAHQHLAEIGPVEQVFSNPQSDETRVLLGERKMTIAKPEEEEKLAKLKAFLEKEGIEYDF